jgi:hypothetical protein
MSYGERWELSITSGGQLEFPGPPYYFMVLWPHYYYKGRFETIYPDYYCRARLLL